MIFNSSQGQSSVTKLPEEGESRIGLKRMQINNERYIYIERERERGGGCYGDDQVLDYNSQDEQHVNKFVSKVLHCFASLFQSPLLQAITP
jgi:hypothetical protein